MSHEEIRILVVLFGFVGTLGVFAEVCLWVTRSSAEIETFLDELDDERSQKRRY